MPETKCLILASVTGIHDVHVTYPCCERCNSKLLIDYDNHINENRWRCIKCCHDYRKEEMSHRYRLSIIITDGKVSCNVCIFGSTLEQFFGDKAKIFARNLDYQEQHHNNSEDLLHLALRQVFIGKFFYFGFKIPGEFASHNSKSLTDVIRYHEETGSIPQTQADDENQYSNIISYQIIPATDARITTVSEIMYYLIKGSNKNTTCPSSNNKPTVCPVKNACISYDSINDLQGSTSSFNSYGQPTLCFSCDLTDTSQRSISGQLNSLLSRSAQRNRVNLSVDGFNGVSSLSSGRSTEKSFSSTRFRPQSNEPHIQESLRTVKTVKSRSTESHVIDYNQDSESSTSHSTNVDESVNLCIMPENALQSSPSAVDEFVLDAVIGGDVKPVVQSNQFIPDSEDIEAFLNDTGFESEGRSSQESLQSSQVEERKEHAGKNKKIITAPVSVRHKEIINEKEKVITKIRNKNVTEQRKCGDSKRKLDEGVEKRTDHTDSDYLLECFDGSDFSSNEFHSSNCQSEPLFPVSDSENLISDVRHNVLHGTEKFNLKSSNSWNCTVKNYNKIPDDILSRENPGCLNNYTNSRLIDFMDSTKTDQEKNKETRKENGDKTGIRLERSVGHSTVNTESLHDEKQLNRVHIECEFEDSFSYLDETFNMDEETHLNAARNNEREIQILETCGQGIQDANFERNKENLGARSKVPGENKEQIGVACTESEGEVDKDLNSKNVGAVGTCNESDEDFDKENMRTIHVPNMDTGVEKKRRETNRNSLTNFTSKKDFMQQSTGFSDKCKNIQNKPQLDRETHAGMNIQCENDNSIRCSQVTSSAMIEESILSVRDVSKVRDSVILMDGSADLFDTTSSSQEQELFPSFSHLQRANAAAYEYKGEEEDLGSISKEKKVKRKSKCVKFAKRLSHVKTTHLIDLQMKMNAISSNRLDVDLRKKSCLKDMFIQESEELFSPCTPGGRQTTPLSPLQSQDLFTPSPILPYKDTDQSDSSILQDSSQNYVCEKLEMKMSTPYRKIYEDVKSNIKHLIDRKSAERSLDLPHESCCNETSSQTQSSPLLFSQSESRIVSYDLSSKSLNDFSSFQASQDLFSPDNSCEKSSNGTVDNAPSFPVKKLFCD